MNSKEATPEHAGGIVEGRIRRSHPVIKSIALGRLRPSQVRWAFRFYQEDPRGFRDYLDNFAPGYTRFNLRGGPRARTEIVAFADYFRISQSEAYRELRRIIRPFRPAGPRAVAA